MVIPIIDLIHVGADKPERDVPVTIDPHGPVAFQRSFEEMEPVTRLVQFCRRCGGIERCQKATELGYVRSLHPTGGTCVVQGLEALVTEADYHGLSVACSDTWHNCGK